MGHNSGQRTIEQTLNLYCKVMREIGARCETIRSLPDNPTLGEVTRYECCYLQFRMICELIALACLVAHGDISETKTSALRDADDANWIIKRLGQLHPDFYPVAGEKIDFEAKTGLKPRPLIDGYLSKAELIELHGRCGGILHRGSIANLAPLMTKVNFVGIKAWEQKIRTLLAYHHIQLLDPQQQLWAAMIGPDGSPTATLMKRE